MLEILFNPFVMAIIGIGIMFLLDKVGFFEWQLKRQQKRMERRMERHRLRMLKKHRRRMWKIRNGIDDLMPLGVFLVLFGLIFVVKTVITGESLFLPVAFIVIGAVIFVISQ